ARRASSRGIPRRTNSSVSMPMWVAISSSSSRSSRADATKSARTRAARTNSGVSTASPIGQPQHPSDHAGNPLPVLGLGRQLAASGFGDRVELRPAVVVGRAPGAGDPAPLLQAEEGRVDRPLIELQHVLADLLDPAGDAVAVQRAHRPEGL